MSEKQPAEQNKFFKETKRRERIYWSGDIVYPLFVYSSNNRTEIRVPFAKLENMEQLYKDIDDVLTRKKDPILTEREKDEIDLEGNKLLELQKANRPKRTEDLRDI